MAGVNQVDLNQTRAVRGVGAQSAAGSASNSRPSGSDSITLSSNSDLVRLALSAGSDARSARVAELQQQVQSGQYQADAGAVSQALINAHLAGE